MTLETSSSVGGGGNVSIRFISLFIIITSNSVELSILGHLKPCIPSGLMGLALEGLQQNVFVYNRNDRFWMIGQWFRSKVANSNVRNS